MTTRHLFEDFERIWNRASSLEEAADWLGCSKRQASDRASAHRQKGRQLKFFEQPPKPPTELLREPDREFDELLERMTSGRGELTRREQLLAGEHIARRAALLRGQAS